MNYGYDFLEPPQSPLPPFKSFFFAILIAIILTVMLFLKIARAEEMDNNSAIKAIIGEAANQDYQGMLAVAVGIRNRGTLQGIYGLKAKHINREPKWVWDLAQKAWQESKYNHIHSGTHWENIKAFGKPKWAYAMKEVYRYKDHIFYK